MQYRPLGNSGLMVSPICLGTMTFGSPVEEAEAIRLTHAAIDMGINFVDTADVYEGYNRYLGSPGGLTETIVGKALRERRDQVILATKVCSPIGPGPQDRGLSAVHIMRQLERSLRSLQTDAIDLYILHWPDKLVPPEVTLQAMDTAVRQGKVRYFGASNHLAWQLCRLLWLADQRHCPRLISSQIPFSMLRRELQHDLEFCHAHGIGVTPYRSLEGGLLTGKYHRGQPPPAGSRAAEKPDWVWKPDEAMFDKLEAIAALADEAGAPVAQYCMAWTLTQPAISSLVVGIKNMQQLQDAVAASDVAIPPHHLANLDAICPPPWRPPDPIRSG